MKYIIILLMVITSCLFTAPALAFTPPVQGTDNATDIILWHGDNLTLNNVNINPLQFSGGVTLSGNFTINDFDDAILAASDNISVTVVNSFEDKFNDLLLFFMIAAFTTLVFWQKNAFLYLVGSVVLMVYGLSFAANTIVMSASWIAGMMIAVVGTYLLFRVAANEILPLLRRKK